MAYFYLTKHDFGLNNLFPKIELVLQRQRVSTTRRQLLMLVCELLVVWPENYRSLINTFREPNNELQTVKAGGTHSY